MWAHGALKGSLLRVALDTTPRSARIAAAAETFPWGIEASTPHLTPWTVLVARLPVWRTLASHVTWRATTGGFGAQSQLQVRGLAGRVKGRGKKEQRDAIRELAPALLRPIVPGQIRVDVMTEGSPLLLDESALAVLERHIVADAEAGVKEVVAYQQEQATWPASPGSSVELSLVLCDDGYITQLNTQYRGKDAPTDVLSFPMGDSLPRGSPVCMLGDLVISLDTAARQATERRYDVRDECRVLLVHGLLHLLGYDHEEGADEAASMAAAEKLLMERLGWQGEGLITLAEEGNDADNDGSGGSSSGGSSTPSSPTTLMSNGSTLGSGPSPSSIASAPASASSSPLSTLLTPSSSSAASASSPPSLGPSSSSSAASQSSRTAPGQPSPSLLVQGSSATSPASPGSSLPPGSSSTTAAPLATSSSSLSASSEPSPLGGVDVAGSKDGAKGDGANAPDAVGVPGSSPMAGEQQGGLRRKRKSEIKLVALDMDGTLLDSKSRVLPSSVAAINAAIAVGVRVCLATGKARPAAMSALSRVGLTGDGLVVSTAGPGIFLQGLAVHSHEGDLLPGLNLSRSMVERAFRFSQEEGIPLCAFLGDHTATLRMTPELQELHERYYEPLPEVMSSLKELVDGPPVKKLLFMTDPAVVDAQLKPFWEAACAGRDTDVMQAVPTMLELVPQGVNKWVGMQTLLPRLGLRVDDVMACGDGGNDFHMVANVGLGVAMRNAVPEVLDVADVVVASNDDGGIAEAFERFVL